MRLRLPLHGRSHLPQGSDPIPGLSGFIRYDFENVGDYLHIQVTNDDFKVIATDLDQNSVNFGTPEFFLKSAADVIFSVDNGSNRPEIGLSQNDWIGYLDGGDDLVYTGLGAGGLTGPGGNFLRNTQGGFAQFDLSRSGHDGGSFLVGTGGGNVNLDASGGSSDSGSVTLSYGTNGELDIFSGGSGLVMQFQADGTIHIQTGATIIADL